MDIPIFCYQQKLIQKYKFLKSIKSFSQLYGNYQQLEPFFQMLIRINITIFSKIPPVFVQVANYNTKNKDKRQVIYIWQKFVSHSSESSS